MTIDTLFSEWKAACQQGYPEKRKFQIAEQIVQLSKNDKIKFNKNDSAIIKEAEMFLYMS